MQLEMLKTAKRDNIFCVADTNFEENEKYISKIVKILINK